MDDRCVELGVEQSRDERGGVALGQDRPDVGMGHGEFPQELGDDPSSGRRNDAQVHDAGHGVVVGGGRGRDRIELPLDPASSLHDPGAGVGQPAGRSVDQGDAEFAFQAGDVARDVRLHGVQRSCRGRERPVIGDGDEGVQLAEIHR
ncbi:MAG: hypothetical protein R2705_17370 [Ilumatobacteraceae bacterium]